MTKPTTKSFSKYIIEIAEPVEPYVWSAPCGFTSKSMNLSASTSSVSVPDCDDPEGSAWDEVGVDGKSVQLQGNGVMADENTPLWEQWFDSSSPKMVRRRIPGSGYRQGLGYLTALGDSVALKSDGNLVQRTMTILGSGPWPWVAGNPADVA